MSWKEEIMQAFNEGKTIQSNHSTGVWRDFRRHNQVDRPNVDYGNESNWRIKPTTMDYESEREQLLIDSGRDKITPMMKEEQPWIEKKYSKDEMLLFAGFCAGRKRVNPAVTGHELWEAWEADFGHD